MALRLARRTNSYNNPDWIWSDAHLWATCIRSAQCILLFVVAATAAAVSTFEKHPSRTRKLQNENNKQAFVQSEK